MRKSVLYIRGGVPQKRRKRKKKKNEAPRKKHPRQSLREQSRKIETRNAQSRKSIDRTAAFRPGCACKFRRRASPHPPTRGRRSPATANSIRSISGSNIRTRAHVQYAHAWLRAHACAYTAKGRVSSRANCIRRFNLITDATWRRARSLLATRIPKPVSRNCQPDTRKFHTLVCSCPACRAFLTTSRGLSSPPALPCVIRPANANMHMPGFLSDKRRN